MPLLRGLLVGVCWIIATVATADDATADARSFPPLPQSDGQATLNAQEWPRQPGPRTVEVYIRYPGGAISQIDERTGLMLSLHNWGGTQAAGAPDPEALARRYNVVAISVDYVQSGKYEAEAGVPYDHGYYQALDALRALYFVWDGLRQAGISFSKGRIYATGGSGGGNVSLMVNKLAPRTFACIIDICGMPKLSDDVAFNLDGGSRLNAGYHPDPDDARYLNADAKAIRFVGNPEHLQTLKALGNECKVVIVHGTTDDACLVTDAREMAANMESAGVDVEPHFIEESDLDGEILTTTGHSLGNRTEIVEEFAGKYLAPGGTNALERKTPSDFELRDENVRYATANGAFVISYTAGFPVGRFERRVTDVESAP